MEIYILGTAGYYRLPILGCKCNVCLSENKKDKRTRSSMLIVHNDKNILFDPNPDVYEQLSKIEIVPTDVFITHIHPDHMLGVLDLKGDKPINFYIPNKEKDILIKIFGQYLDGIYNFNDIGDKTVIEFDGLKVTAYSVNHSVPTFGFRIEEDGKSLAYIPSFKELPDRMLLLASNIAILDGSSLVSHPDHMQISESLRRAKGWRVHSLYYTHIGHNVLPHDALTEHMQKQWNRVKILFDGQKLSLGEEKEEEVM